MTAAAAYRPLTERVLDRLPGWRWGWVVAWSLLAPGTYLLLHLADPNAPYPGDVFVVAFAWAGLAGLWGSAAVSHRLDALQPTLARLLPPGVDPAAPFRPVGSTVGPLIGAALVTLAFEVADFLAAPSAATAARIGPVLVGQLSVAAYIWVLVTLLIGIDRVGRVPLRLLPFHEDPGLGLKPIGRLAFLGFIVAFLAALPIAASTYGDLRSLGTMLGLLLVGAALFFLSVYRLHRQLIAARTEHLTWVRALYGRALAPVLAGAEPEALARQAPSLSAAAELEHRVHSIAEWPFDDWIPRAIAAILIGATAGVVARAIGLSLSI